VSKNILEEQSSENLRKSENFQLKERVLVHNSDTMPTASDTKITDEANFPLYRSADSM